MKLSLVGIASLAQERVQYGINVKFACPKFAHRLVAIIQFLKMHCIGEYIC